MSTPIQIRRTDVVRNVRQLAALKGKSVTETVAELAGGELNRLQKRSEADIEARRAAIREAVERFRALPTVGPLLSDDDLYDEHGLPK